MAMHLLDGEWSTFYWGQDYGGTIDVILASPFVAVWGSTRAALQVIPFLQSVAATVLVGAVARRILGWRGAVTAAAIFWSFPAAFVWWQTRQSLLYLPIVVLGLVVVLCVQRLWEDPSRRLDWLIMGLAAGLGWWTSPQIVYFLLPAALWLLTRRPLSELNWGWWVAIPGFVIGAGPWFVTNTVNGWRSLTNLPEVADGPIDRLVALVTGGLPMTLGAKVPFSEAWIGPLIGPAVYLVGLGALIVAATVRRPSRPVHVWLLCAFPILFVLIPAAAYVGSGRYFFFLGPPVAIALSSLPRTDVVRVVLLGGCVLLTTVGQYQMRNLPISFVPDVDPLVEVLNQANVDHVVGGFWLAYKLAWETGEEIIATPVAVSRYPEYGEEVRRADAVAYVFNLYEPSQKQSAEVLRDTLNDRGLAYADLPADGYAVIVPDQVVLPEDVPAAAIPTP
jgi:4-amino-4-deoxy-L-arabinose transferase-like glycosyltransferase